jgi:membrane-anchored glycerophosphoryl diester phosphodiesterase (GDPDase)
MKTFEIVILVIIGLSIYLNIGFLVMEYYRKNIFDKKELTTVFAKIAVGAWKLCNHGSADFLDWIVLYVGWPINFIGIMASWVIFLICKLLWLIFAGGIVKSIGLYKAEN